MVAPFWFGSNMPGAWAFNALLFATAALIYEVSLIARQKPHPMPLSRIALPAAGVLFVVGWIVFQWMPGTPSALWPPIWDLASPNLSVPLEGRISVNPDITLIALLRLATAIIVFWLGAQFGADAERGTQALMAIGVVGAAYAAFGMIYFVVAPGMTLWTKASYPDAVTSTFINRNSFATYAGIIVLVLISLVLRVYRRAAQSAGTRKWSVSTNLIRATAGEGGFLLVAVFFSVAALFMSTSRGGVLSFLVALVSLMGLLSIRRGSGRITVIAMGFAIAITVIAFATFGASLLDRLEAQELASNSRAATYAITWQSITDAPWTGYGYGTFADVFPMYRDETAGSHGVWSKAHNTYLEIFQGLGLPLGMVMILSAGLVVVRCLRGALTRRRHVTAPLVAVASTVLVATHALVDFSLQIQAVTLSWMALLGLGLAQSFATPRDGARGPLSVQSSGVRR